MTNNIKAGDKVQVNTEICTGMGLYIYAEAGIQLKTTYEVTSVELDESDAYNERYGGYIHLDGVEKGYYVMEDFKVVEAGE